MKEHKTIKKILIALLATGFLAAGCATSPDGAAGPHVQLTEESPVHISPAASPGEQDMFRTPVVAEASGEAVVSAYEVRVDNEDGEPIYRFSASADDAAVEQMKESGLNALPTEILWNGRDEKSQFVPEGNYILTVSVTDSAGRSGESAPFSVIVNNSTPQADVEVGYNVFSPDGDGERDVMPIRQYGSDASQWSGRIVNDEGTTVASWDWEYDLPEELRWDGYRLNGDIVEDGRYTYVLTGHDEAGNRVTVRQENIRVDTADRSLALETDRRAFSPDGDEIRDTITFTPELPEDTQSIDWQFSVSASDGDTVMDRSGESDIPASFTFTGMSDGETLSEGMYTAEMTVTFRNGETETAEAREVELDVTSPEVTVGLGQDQFSPDSDADPETQEITITHKTDGGVSWKGRIIPANDDNAILTRNWNDSLPETFSWNGQTGRGDAAGTGQYRYVLSATDRAGNRSVAESNAFLLDRDAPSVSVDVAPTPFYPGADDRVSNLEISIETDDRSGIEEQEITVYDPEGNVFTRLDSDQESFSWNGRNDDGELPQSARDYTLAVTVVDSVGNASTVEETVSVGILVEEDQAGDLRFRITGIRFAPFEADYTDLEDQDVVEENRETLDEIAALLKEYPNQQIRVEGHAVHIYYEEGDVKEREQEEVLLPLSEERAEAIVDALVDRGVDADRLNAVGRGGSEPLVPHEDRENRWKNRRVEFELIN
ncbi:MAG: gliding motility-associated C-terminal domain-containing protein [Spirochaeta sp.]|jgi:outer membrane protein OmpA-like peptidoglycan-associated protein|nr:gliding motility-associated C-terminal domain-containing protein [Spirochaeta sp.]